MGLGGSHPARRPPKPGARRRSRAGAGPALATPRVREQFGGRWPFAGFIRMSSGPIGLEGEPPSSGRRSASRRVPRSARNTSAPPVASARTSVARPAKFIRRATDRIGRNTRVPGAGPRPGATRSGRRRPRSAVPPAGRPASNSRACPPKPSVASTATSPGFGSRTPRISRTMIGRCEPAGVLPASSTLATSSA